MKFFKFISDFIFGKENKNKNIVSESDLKTKVQEPEPVQETFSAISESSTESKKIEEINTTKEIKEKTRKPRTKTKSSLNKENKEEVVEKKTRKPRTKKVNKEK